jgi:hypothetical protein
MWRGGSYEVPYPDFINAPIASCPVEKQKPLSQALWGLAVIRGPAKRGQDPCHTHGSGPALPALLSLLTIHLVRTPAYLSRGHK